MLIQKAFVAAVIFCCLNVSVAEEVVPRVAFFYPIDFSTNSSLTEATNQLVADGAGGCAFFVQLDDESRPGETLNHLVWLNARGQEILTNQFRLTNATAQIVRFTASRLAIQIWSDQDNAGGKNIIREYSRKGSLIKQRDLRLGPSDFVAGYPLLDADSTGYLILTRHTINSISGTVVPRYYLKRVRY
jgi:hypothetical protein